jgi:hypothetical protein
MVERTLGLRRDPAIQGVDGFEAVRLWHRYRRGDRAALEKLALYNLTDVANLVELVEIAVRLKSRLTAFPGNGTLCQVNCVTRPNSNDLARRIAEYL